MFDVWGYLSGGFLVLEALAWTNDTTRATALTTQDGVYVKSGDATRRYLGSYRTLAASQIEDTVLRRFVFNYYNRVPRSMVRGESTTTWTYSTASYRQVNNSTSNQISAVIGVSEDSITVIACNTVLSSGATGRPVAGGIGINSTTVNSARS